MLNLCNKKNIPFANVWHTFWGQNNLFVDNSLKLNDSGASILASHWHNLLSIVYPNSSPTIDAALFLPADQMSTIPTIATTSSNNLTLINSMPNVTEPTINSE